MSRSAEPMIAAGMKADVGPYDEQDQLRALIDGMSVPLPERFVTEGWFRLASHVGLSARPIAAVRPVDRRRGAWMSG